MNFFNVETFCPYQLLQLGVCVCVYDKIMIFYYQPYNFLPTKTLWRYVFFNKLIRFCIFVLSFINLISVSFIQFICL